MFKPGNEVRPSSPPKLRATMLRRQEDEKALLDCLTRKMLTNLPSSRHVWEEAEGLRRRRSYGMLYFLKPIHG